MGFQAQLIYKIGSGKTSLLIHLLKTSCTFVFKEVYKKFDEIIIMSPSVTEFWSLFLPPENTCGELDWDFVYSRINKIKCPKYTNVLFIFDE